LLATWAPNWMLQPPLHLDEAVLTLGPVEPAREPPVSKVGLQNALAAHRSGTLKTAEAHFKVRLRRSLI